jgi:trimethylamine:corrinoid methyltransferase-like protein
MVIDNEFAGSICRLRNGTKVDPDSLALEVVATVMDGPRNFLGQKHTMKNLKLGEIFMTHLAERGSWVSWEKTGKIGMVERAQAEADRILHDHHVPPLDDTQERELDQLMVAAQNELVK